MNRYLLVAIEAAIAALLLSDAAMAQQRPPLCWTTNKYTGAPAPPAVLQACETLKNQLIGTWALVSYDFVPADGHKYPLLGVNPKGMLTLDGVGNFTEIFSRIDAPPPPDEKINPDDVRAPIQGTKAKFGRFWINPGYNNSGRWISLEAEFTSPDKPSEKSTVGSIWVLTADDLEYRIPSAYNRSVSVVWKRVRAQP